MMEMLESIYFQIDWYTFFVSPGKIQNTNQIKILILIYHPIPYPFLFLWTPSIYDEIDISSFVLFNMKLDLMFRDFKSGIIFSLIIKVTRTS